MSRVPHVLVLHGNNVGDRNQAEALARLVGFPSRMVQLHPPRRPKVPKLAAPRPDLIIAVDRRSTDIALQIKRESRRPVKVVKIGVPYFTSSRPVFGKRTISADVDLYITSEHYAPAGDVRMVQQELPFSMVDADELQRIRPDFARLDQLPSPRIAVLVGGRNRYFRWTPEIAAALGRKISDEAARAGGSLLVTTSYRTGAECTEALLSAITVPHDAYRWGEDEGANPLMGYLACADRIIVTIDSIAMVADALNTGKPVSIYPLQAKRFAALKALAERFFSVSMRTALIKKLLASGDVAWVGEPDAPPRRIDHSRYAPAVDAVRELALSAVQSG